MSNNFENLIYNKIIHNSEILIDKLNSEFNHLPLLGRLTALVYSTAFTLDLIFPDKKYNNFDLNSVLDLVAETIIRSQKLIIEGVENQHAIIDDVFFEEQINSSLFFFKGMNYDKDFLLKEIEHFTNERKIVMAVFVAEKKPIFYYNAFINIYIFPFFNCDFNKEKMKEIRKKLDLNEDFINSKNDFTIIFHQANTEMIENLSSELFLNTIKYLKDGSIPNLGNKFMGDKYKDENKNCYVATLAYGDINHPRVEF